MRHLKLKLPSTFLFRNKLDKRVTGCMKYAIAFTILIAVLAMSVSVLNLLQKQQRHFLFCEVIKPGMTLGETLIIVNDNGRFVENQFENGNSTVLLLGPEDFETIAKYGMRGIVLRFDGQILRNVGDYYPMGNGNGPLCK